MLCHGRWGEQGLPVGQSLGATAVTPPRGPRAPDCLWGTKMENKGLAVAVLSDPSLPAAPAAVADGTGLDWGPAGGRLWEQRKRGGHRVKMRKQKEHDRPRTGTKPVLCSQRGRVRCGTPRLPPALTWLPPTPMSGWPGEAQEPHLWSLHSTMTWRCPRPSHNPPEEGGG